KRLPPKQQRVIDRFIALFVATSGVPYSVCNNKWLKRALAEAGASTLSPKRLKTTLNTLYEETRMEKDAELKDQLQAGESVMLCTDGWRHRRAGHAHPLLNLVLLKPNGGCYFYDCFPLDKGAKKTAQFYADMHERLAMKVTGGDPRLLLGVIMDSPSTNRAALRLLERKYPSWICMTCCVHAMNLICKDLANETRMTTPPPTLLAHLPCPCLPHLTRRLLDPINFKYLNHVAQPYPDFDILTEMQRVELEPTIVCMDEKRDNMAPPLETLINILA
ncbi:hypothetical protein QJQ45_023158, partial [Haematococcus lacustris]